MVVGAGEGGTAGLILMSILVDCVLYVTHVEGGLTPPGRVFMGSPGIMGVGIQQLHHEEVQGEVEMFIFMHACARNKLS
jgi:hypothetical protein